MRERQSFYRNLLFTVLSTTFLAGCDTVVRVNNNPTLLPEPTPAATATIQNPIYSATEPYTPTNILTPALVPAGESTVFIDPFKRDGLSLAEKIKVFFNTSVPGVKPFNTSCLPLFYSSNFSDEEKKQINSEFEKLGSGNCETFVDHYYNVYIKAHSAHVNGLFPLEAEFWRNFLEEQALYWFVPLSTEQTLERATELEGATITIEQNGVKKTYTVEAVTRTSKFFKEHLEANTDYWLDVLIDGDKEYRQLFSVTNLPAPEEGRLEKFKTKPATVITFCGHDTHTNDWGGFQWDIFLYPVE
jgi:hypothetical protein